VLKLFYAPGACSLAPHIVLEEIGSPYEAQAVDLHGGEQRSAAYLKTNPKGKVPALQTERGVLTENPVILGYLAQRFPQAQLAPLEDAFAFASLQSFNTYLATTVHVTFARLFRSMRFVDGDAALESLKSKAAQALDECFQLIDQQLSDGRAYVHGDAFTVSDPYLYVFARWTSRPGAMVELARYPHVQSHRDRVQARPAAQRALAAEGLS